MFINIYNNPKDIIANANNEAKAHYQQGEYDQFFLKRYISIAKLVELFYISVFNEDFPKNLLLEEILMKLNTHLKLSHSVLSQARKIRITRNKLVHDNMKIKKSKGASALDFFDKLEKTIHAKEDIAENIKKDSMINSSTPIMDSKLKKKKIIPLKTSVLERKRSFHSRKQNLMASKVQKSPEGTISSSDIAKIIKSLEQKSTELYQEQKGKNFNQIVRIGNMRCNIVRKVHKLMLIQQNCTKMSEDDIVHKLKKLGLLKNFIHLTQIIGG